MYNLNEPLTLTVLRLSVLFVEVHAKVDILLTGSSVMKSSIRAGCAIKLKGSLIQFINFGEQLLGGRTKISITIYCVKISRVPYQD